MPIRNVTKERILPYTVMVADTLTGRLIGLLSDENPDPQKAAYFKPCGGIHTFGMRYPIDVIFLDRKGEVVKLFRNLPPNRVTGLIPSAHSAIELPGDTAHGMEIGDLLEVKGDERLQVDIRGVRRLLLWPMNMLLALL